MQTFDEALQDAGSREVFRRANRLRLSSEMRVNAPDVEVGSLGDLAAVYLEVALRAYEKPQEKTGSRVKFALAFDALCAWEVGKNRDLPMLDDELLSSRIGVLFWQCICGLLAQRSAEVRHNYAGIRLPEPRQSSWKTEVAESIALALIYFIRKADGWGDIDRGLGLIDALKHLQASHEAEHLERLTPDEQGEEALLLVGLYNLAQIVEQSGRYLASGEPGAEAVLLRVGRHLSNALECFTRLASGALVLFARAVGAASAELCANSIWSHADDLGEKASAFVQALTSRQRANPVLEFWPSQQRALSKNLLDPYSKAVIVQMPTSSGKTLLAKFSILQTLSLNPSGIVTYVVPTRALVNQVTNDLRADFAALSPRISVEQAIPAFELDPTEDQLLREVPNVLVTTAEKLDALIRRDHPVVENITLVVADEAHSISDRTRGARLELLLGTIKREKRHARFLLLSPFIPESEDIAEWLGGTRDTPPIVVDWRPSERVVGELKYHSHRGDRHLSLHVVPSVDSVDLPADVELPLGQVALDRSGVKDLTVDAAIALSGLGTTLVFCPSPNAALERAWSIAVTRPEKRLSGDVAAALDFIANEIGKDHRAFQCMKRGVGVHHAGFSGEAKALVEALLRDTDAFDTVCGTTTLAEGVNFPIKTVVFETLKLRDSDGKSRPLSFDKFWNIAGRAGRALLDSFGIVAFPVEGAERSDQLRNYMVKTAEFVASQVAKMVVDISDTSDFSEQRLRETTELDALLQYLSHAMKVAEAGPEDLEDIVSGSLAFYQGRKLGSDVTTKLRQLCRSYMSKIKGQTGLMELADRTGFATPSVLKMLTIRDADKRELAERSKWAVPRLFGDDLAPLAKRVEIVADLPNIKLGTQRAGPFNATVVAAITRDWVKGKSIAEIAKALPPYAESTDLTKLSKYLYGTLSPQLSWGMGALETVCLAGSDLGVSEEAYVPSMIYFGVNTREAIWMRMAGVPRAISADLANLWRESAPGKTPASFSELRSWIKEASSKQRGETSSGLSWASARNVLGRLIQG